MRDEKQSLEKIKILYIDDEVNNLNAFKASFRRDFDITLCESPLDARALMDQKEFDIIVTDQRMPEMTGTEFLSSILEEFPDPMRILLTGFSDIEAVIDAINKGQVYRYVTKPWHEEELKGIIKGAYEVYALRQENKVLTKSLLQANEQLEFMLRQKLLS